MRQTIAKWVISSDRKVVAQTKSIAKGEQTSTTGEVKVKSDIKSSSSRSSSSSSASSKG